MTRVAVIGAGAFGTALALLSHSRGHETRVWAFESELPERVRAERENAVFLPGVPVPPELVFSGDAEFVLEDADLALLVVPSQFVRRVAKTIGPAIPKDALIGCCAKGIESDTLKLMSEVLEEVLSDSIDRHAFLSGPTFAKELARGHPMDIAVAGRDIAVARGVQAILHHPAFRVYAGDDPIGIETAGALKNVIAIACGTADEMGMGLSARASLISRGLAEITRFGVAMGAQPVTFLGLAGVGDLVLTCTGDLSRNRTLGKQIAHGEKAKDILTRQSAVAEGYHTARPAWELAKKLGVDAPIVEQVYHVLYEDRELSEAIRLLMTRGPKDEFVGIL